VVDDEPTLRLGFRLALVTEGFEVIEAGDGEQALQALEDGSPALMVLDLRMPGLGGIEVLNRAVAASTAIPTVIASAQINPQVAAEAMRLGVVDFLHKPIRPGDLREVVRAILSEESAYHGQKAPAQVQARCLLRRRLPEQAFALLSGENTPENTHLPWLRAAELLCEEKSFDPALLPIECFNRQ